MWSLRPVGFKDPLVGPIFFAEYCCWISKKRLFQRWKALWNHLKDSFWEASPQSIIHLQVKGLVASDDLTTVGSLWTPIWGLYSHLSLWSSGYSSFYFPQSIICFQNIILLEDVPYLEICGHLTLSENLLERRRGWKQTKMAALVGGSSRHVGRVGPLSWLFLRAQAWSFSKPGEGFLVALSSLCP